VLRLEERQREIRDPPADLNESPVSSTFSGGNAERTVEAESRKENLRELIGVGAEFEARFPDAGLPEFLELIALVTEQDEYDEAASTVTLMTLHNAKGLEFEVVFIAGMEDGVFPHFRSMTDADELEEERRLAYAGLTRARKRLYLAHAWSRSLFGESSYNPPSRFLNEIPSELIEELEQGNGPKPGSSHGPGTLSTISRRAAASARHSAAISLYRGFPKGPIRSQERA
jgi:superfamily I DNA/RNA helicase